ncbi:acyl-CoA dehydrogenase [Ancylobacter sp. Lp-2]|uniref:acyl-CoA dehydrogenase family protein n=1 Tax=Ancylobacter sp. Lp-2 TaxID=2881339 RepID=UPI001E2A115A|nr:acyl-CoA dehydrogenase family protein [Ancylobacter sp. Lp-2]MCB4768651.1 acyl-CoA dehydrogenase [Ancylobacter sp. Lp-2]
MTSPVSPASIKSAAPITGDGADPFEGILQRIAEGAVERDRSRLHPVEALRELKNARFGALSLPRDEGGGGAGLRGVIEQAIRLATADANVAHIFRNHFLFVERFLVAGPDERGAEWRRAVLDGAIFGLASTELDRKQTGGASDFSTLLTPDGDGYRLTGRKYYSTGTFYADFVLVRATIPGEGGASIVVPTDRDGIERIDDWDGIGQRVTGSGTTVFDNVAVQPREVLPDGGNPPYLLPFTSTLAQVYVTAIIVGILKAAERDAATLLKGRGRNFYFAPSERTVEDPILLQAIGRISSDAFAAELAVLAAADALERVSIARAEGRTDLEERAHEASLIAAKAKIVVDELALRSTTALFDVGGASAALRERGLDRHWRNARTLASHNPASYKALAVGGYEINGTRLPSLGFF